MKPSTTTKVHKLFEQWLRGTTCNYHKKKHKILFENNEWIVFKHTGHNEYCNRVVGVLYCETYAVLYRKENIDLYELGQGKGDTYKWVVPKGKGQKLSLDEIIQICKDYYHTEFDNDYVSDQWIDYVEPPLSKAAQELVDAAKRLTSIDGNIKI